jgi:hypothetical protein
MTRDEIEAARDADGERRLEREMEREHDARLRAAPPSAAPVPSHRGTTHHAECWQVRGHHECAIAEVERLRAENERLWIELDAARKEAGNAE